MLRKNEYLFLVAGLSLADFLLALLIIPYITYLLVDWDEEINYSPFLILPLTTPTVSEIKMSSILTVSIAIDRLIAIQWPVFYQFRNKRHYAIGAFLTGLIWAVVDGISLFAMSEFRQRPGCAAGGCFLGEQFRYYWGVSNMILGLVAMAATLLLIMKLREHSKFISPMFSPEATRIQEQKKFKHANIIAMNVLLVSGVCIILPNCLTGFGEMFGLSFHRKMGPIVSLGLVLSGVCNSFIYGMKQRDIRLTISGFLKKNQIAPYEQQAE
uniref:G-protein coupled receptors family 1 profile domain-containing protein n=1 Tax=Plectus sambesii TaxID=2011161 RepID=A0A914V9S2_9BILA